MEIGEKIKTVRKALGFSQGKLAKASNVTRETISRWENKPEHKPTYDSLYRIATAMNVTPGYIMDYGDPVAEWKHPVTAAAKLDMAKVLLDEVAEKYPHGRAAQALRVLEREDDPGEIQDYLGRARSVLLSDHDMAAKTLMQTVVALENLAVRDALRLPTTTEDDETEEVQITDWVEALETTRRLVGEDYYKDVLRLITMRGREAGIKKKLKKKDLEELNKALDLIEEEAI